MSYTHVQLLKAQNEILDAWEWYEDKQPGLGDRFKNEVKRKIDAIVSDPFLYPKKGKYHQALTDDFSYLIVFDIDTVNNIIFIISVFHTSRHPKNKY